MEQNFWSGSLFSQENIFVTYNLLHFKLQHLFFKANILVEIKCAFIKIKTPGYKMKNLPSSKKTSVKSTPALNKHQKLLLQRIENTTIAILSKCKSEQDLIYLSTLNDDELLKLLVMKYNPKRKK